MRPDNILTVSYLEKHPADAARVLENFPHTMSSRLLDQLPPDKFIDVFQFLIPSYAANLLTSLQDESKGTLADILPSEKLFLLLSFLDEDSKKNILGLLSADKRKSVVRHMQYPLGTVGTIMGPPLFSLPNDITAAEALKRIKNSRRKYPSAMFVIDRSQHYIGIVSLDRLIKAPSNTRLSAITDSSLQPLSTRKNIRNLASDPAWTTSLMLPVINSRGVFAGILQYMALMQHSRSENLQTKHQETSHNLSIAELIFQTLGVLLEVLVKKIFPVRQKIRERDRHHDNVI